MIGASACLLAAAGALANPALSRAAGDLEALVPGRAQATRRTALALVGLAAVIAVDRPLARAVARHAPSELHHVEPLGRVAAGNAVGAALFAAGLVEGDGSLRVAGLTALEANLMTGWLVTLGQHVAGRRRPGRPHESDWRRGGSSFPSSHAAHAFAWAGVLYEALPRWRARWLLPTLAGTVALSRVADRQHFAGDVLAGAALGWWIGSRLEAAHAPGARARIALLPVAGNGLDLAISLP
jgi:membrane-associated phospholipid phosphatase